jgi:hypothetical protein
MWIVAIAWIYVVGLMALTEPSLVAGIMTLLGYCVLPLSILYYLTGSKRRRARKARIEENARRASADVDTRDGGEPGGTDGAPEGIARQADVQPARSQEH